MNISHGNLHIINFSFTVWKSWTQNNTPSYLPIIPSPFNRKLTEMLKSEEKDLMNMRYTRIQGEFFKRSPRLKKMVVSGIQYNFI